MFQTVGCTTDKLDPGATLEKQFLLYIGKVRFTLLSSAQQDLGHRQGYICESCTMYGIEMIESELLPLQDWWTVRCIVDIFSVCVLALTFNCVLVQRTTA